MTPAGTRVVGYVRVSTDEQGDSGLGLASQRDTIEAEAVRRNWQLIDIVSETASGKSTAKRPELERVLAVLEAGFADALVVAKLDRLTRSLLDFVTLTARAREQGWAIVVLDKGFDMTTPNGRLMANMLASFAEYERELISERTKAALAVKRRQGHRLGRPPMLEDKLVSRIVAMKGSGKSFAAIARQLNDDAVPTAHGGEQWHASTVKAVIDRRNREAHQVSSS